MMNILILKKNAPPAIAKATLPKSPPAIIAPDAAADAAAPAAPAAAAPAAAADAADASVIASASSPWPLLLLCPYQIRALS